MTLIDKNINNIAIRKQLKSNVIAAIRENRMHN